GLLVVCTSSALVASLLYSALGVPGALVLGLLSGAAEAVPVFGPLSVCALVVISALPLSPSLAVWAGGAMLANHLLHGYVVLPRLIGGAVGVSPLLVLLSLSALASLFGVRGALLAVPAAAVLQLGFDAWRQAQPRGDERQERVGLLRLRARELVRDARQVI